MLVEAQRRHRGHVRAQLSSKRHWLRGDHARKAASFTSCNLSPRTQQLQDTQVKWSETGVNLLKCMWWRIAAQVTLRMARSREPVSLAYRGRRDMSATYNSTPRQLALRCRDVATWVHMCVRFDAGPADRDLHAQAKHLFGPRAAPEHRSCAALLARLRAALVRLPAWAALESVQLGPLQALPRSGRSHFATTLQARLVPADSHAVLRRGRASHFSQLRGLQRASALCAARCRFQRAVERSRTGKHAHQRGDQSCCSAAT